MTYADDNTPYAIECDIDELFTTLQKDIDILLKWFHDNYFEINEDKCHLLVTNQDQDISLITNQDQDISLITNQDQDISLMIGKELIKDSKSVKLFGITIDNKLNFNDHVTKVCNKVSQKLHILAIFNSMQFIYSYSGTPSGDVTKNYKNHKSINKNSKSNHIYEH